METIRSLAQSHVASLSLTAAIDPGEMITDQMEAEYLATALLMWQQVDQTLEGLGLDFLPMTNYYPIVKESIERSRRRYIDVLKSLIDRQAMSTPVYGEFFFVPDYVSGTGTKPPQQQMVQFGDVRPIIGELGGGGPAEVPLSTGITGGTVLQEVLSANGVSSTEKMWLYGETQRRVFNGHLQVDGLVFSDWNDDALDIAPQDRWIRSNKYRPGDHWGCACVVVPYIPNFGNPIPMTITS